MAEHHIEEKSYDFSIRIVRLYKYLVDAKCEYVLSKQVLRSGTSIGANICEGKYAQSKADFKSKMKIALKEANETHYWLRLLHDTEYLSDKEFEDINVDIREIIKILIAICKNIK